MKNRNSNIDVVRGFAMLLVVLGHTISGSVTNYSNSLMYQAIWTLQMPMFIILSGYLTLYSSPILTHSGLLHFIKKRSLAYLFPWTVWTIIVRGLIFGDIKNFDFRYILWHMDSGYWFLITLWTISIIYAVSDFMSNKSTNNKLLNIVYHIIFCLSGLLVLTLIGFTLGFKFFSIKLTLYYTPFYLLGFLYGRIQNIIEQNKNYNRLKDYFIIVFLGVWITSINKFDFYEAGDDIFPVVFRILVSVLGCTSVIYLMTGFYAKSSSSGWKVLKWIGIHSLEIYLIHYLVLCFVKYNTPPILESLSGWFIVFVNFTIAIGLSFIYIKAIESNKLLNKILFWK